MHSTKLPKHKQILVQRMQRKIPFQASRIRPGILPEKQLHDKRRHRNNKQPELRRMRVVEREKNSNQHRKNRQRHNSPSTKIRNTHSRKKVLRNLQTIPRFSKSQKRRSNIPHATLHKPVRRTRNVQERNRRKSNATKQKSLGDRTTSNQDKTRNEKRKKNNRRKTNKTKTNTTTKRTNEKMLHSKKRPKQKLGRHSSR